MHTHIHTCILVVIFSNLRDFHVINPSIHTRGRTQGNHCDDADRDLHHPVAAGVKDLCVVELLALVMIGSVQWERWQGVLVFYVTDNMNVK